MEPASAVAGLIGLAALTAKTALGLSNAVKNVRNISEHLSKRLHGVSQLAIALNDISDACKALEESKTNVNVGTMKGYLQDCLDALRPLEKMLETSVEKSNVKSRTKRTISKLRASFKEKDVEDQLAAIQATVNGINCCHSSIVMQAVAQSSNRMASIEHLLTVQATENQSLRLYLLSMLDAIQSGQTDLQSHVIAITGTLSGLQLKTLLHEESAQAFTASSTRVNSTIEREAGDGDFQDFWNFKNLAIQCPTEGPKPTPPTKNNQTEEEERIKFFHEPQTCSAYDNQLSRSSNDHIGRKEGSIIRWPKAVNTEIQFRTVFGSVVFRIFETPEPLVEKGREHYAREDLHTGIQILITPSLLLCRRVFKANVVYSKTHGLSSPTNLQIEMPVMRPLSELDVDALLNLGMNEFRKAYIRRGYRPNDIFVLENNHEYLTLLSVAARMRRLDICHFMLDIGAKLDRSTSSSFKLSLDNAYWGFACMDIINLGVSIVELGPYDGHTTSLASFLERAINCGARVPDVWILGLLFDFFEPVWETFYPFLQRSIEYGEGFFADDPLFAYLAMFTQDGEGWDENTQFENCMQTTKRFHLNLKAEDNSGWTALHIACDGYRMENSSLKGLFKGIIASGSNIFALTKEDISATLIIFLYDRNAEAWIEGLSELGFNLEEIARHTIRCLHTRNMERLFKSCRRLSRLYKNDADAWLSQNITSYYDRRFRAELIDLLGDYGQKLGVVDLVFWRFREVGVNLTKGEWMYEEPLPPSSSSSVDFTRTPAFDMNEGSTETIPRDRNVHGVRKRLGRR